MVDMIMDEAIGPRAPDTAKWARIGALLEALLALPAGKRCAWLDEACGTDASLRAELESLAAASAGSASFLDRPALEFLTPDRPSADSETATMPMGEVPSLAPSGPAPGRTIGHYRLLAKLGEGGMGVVYKAVDVRLDRTAAVKLITRFDGTGIEKRRFFREAKAASALNHPNIVTIYEYDADGAMDYLAMEYIPGTTLDRLTADRPLPLKTLLGYACQVAGALASAHDAGMVHRDLKPGNIMVTADGIVKVLDFGLARYVADSDGADSLTRTGSTVGTPGYMSPEQAKGEPAGHCSDIFSFGIILYEMACGCHPFRGPDRLATLNNIVRQEPPSAAAVNPAIPSAVVTVIECCLRKDPAERPQSMAAIRADLLAAADSPTAGVPRAGIPRANIPSQRRAPALVLAGVAVAGALGGAGWYAGRRRSAPASTLTYRLEVQKRGGAPYAALTAETFHADDKFRLRVESPQTGFFYLVNEGPGQNGQQLFWLLYPPVSGSAALAANRPFETGWYVFDPNPGTERLWIVFAHEPAPALQDALAASKEGEVKDPALAVKVREFLGKLERRSKTTVAGSGVRLQAAESVLGEEVQLRHQ